MKQSQIRLLVVVMSAALLGLLAVQWFWVRNAVSLREKQFHYRVKSAMNAVAERLQDREIAIAIANGDDLGRPSPPQCCRLPNSHPASTPPASAHQVTFTPVGILGSHEQSRPRRFLDQPVTLLGIDSVPSRITQRQFTSRQYVNGQWVSEQTLETRIVQGDSELVVQEHSNDPASLAYVHGFIERMLRSGLPFHQRIDSTVLDSMIRQELERRDIDESFVYGVHHESLLPSFVVEDSSCSPVDHSKPFFTVQLFPHDLRPSDYFLELQFPEHSSPTLQAMGVVLPTSGALVLIVMCCFGIALFAFRRQQKLNDLKTDFINNMTHELKTPISTISLALEALGDPDMQTRERIATYARVIGQENERMKTQVERVLQAAALERGELKLQMEPLDLEELLLEQVERLRLHVESRGGVIDYLPEALDTSAMGDAVHLGNVIFNLLDNANKYSPEKPHIEITTRNVPGGLEIGVRDRGVGIDTDDQRKVFDKFYRVPTGNVHDVKGFGIGLSYARSMARAHGGDIRLESAPGQGSTFTLFIPQNETT